MSENVENLMLEHLKRFQATLDRVERKQEEAVVRMATLEGHIVSIMQHIAHNAAAHAALQVSVDNINTRLDRVERRLELTH